MKRQSVHAGPRISPPGTLSIVQCTPEGLLSGYPDTNSCPPAPVVSPKCCWRPLPVTSQLLSQDMVRVVKPTYSALLSTKWSCSPPDDRAPTSHVVDWGLYGGQILCPVPSSGWFLFESKPCNFKFSLRLGWRIERHTNEQCFPSFMCSWQEFKTNSWQLFLTLSQ